MHNEMPFAVHFDVIALEVPASVAVGKIMPLMQQKMCGLNIGPVITQQKTYNHEVLPLTQQKMSDHDNVCYASS